MIHFPFQHPSILIILCVSLAHKAPGLIHGNRYRGVSVTAASSSPAGECAVEEMNQKEM